MNDDPLIFAINSTVASATAVGSTVWEIIHNDAPSICDMVNSVHVAIGNSDASRCIIYKEMNPDFLVHEVYYKKHAINDLQRISFTRFRVSGHSLAIETGRWNRRGRGRLPVEERLCDCGLVQTERHVVEECPRTQLLRSSFGLTSLDTLFSDCNNDVACRGRLFMRF